jgi:hypothetical protein
MIQITLPDGSQREFPGPVTVADVAASIGSGLAKAALAGKIDGKVVDTAGLDRASLHADIDTLMDEGKYTPAQIAAWTDNGARLAHGVTIKPSAKLQADGRDSGALQAFGASLPTSSKVSAASLASRCLGEIG